MSTDTRQNLGVFFCRSTLIVCHLFLLVRCVVTQFVQCRTPSASFRWKGDYGGRLQLFFPANYVEEISNSAQAEAKAQVPISAEVTGGQTVAGDH